ncbi:MAG: nucleotide pyrophosphohydrolase, partial [Gammaproteobacteria bacterium]
MILDLEKVKIALRKFTKEREWEKFHNPKNLATALSVEASELLEIFQ